MTKMYLAQPDLPTAQARSNQQARTLGCDGVLTQYWWSVQPLTDGTAAIVIMPGTPFDVTTSNAVSPQPVGLTADEQASLQGRAQLGTLLPNIITQADFQTVLGAQAISAVQASPALTKQFAPIAEQQNVDLEDPAVQAFLADAVAAGTISAETQFTILNTNTLAPVVAQPVSPALPVPARI
jgi:hypothetical protein